MFTVNVPYNDGEKDVIFARANPGAGESYIHNDVAERHRNHWERTESQGEVRVKISWVIERPKAGQRRDGKTWCIVSRLPNVEPQLIFGDNHDPAIRNTAMPTTSNNEADRGGLAGREGGRYAPVVLTDMTHDASTHAEDTDGIEPEQVEFFVKVWTEGAKQLLKGSKKRPLPEGEDTTSKRSKTRAEDLPDG